MMCMARFWNNLSTHAPNRKVGKPNILKVFGIKKNKYKHDGQDS